MAKSSRRWSPTSPGFKSLTAEAGIRYSDYSVFATTPTSYNTTTYKAGGSYEPFDGLKLRGNYQRAVRAPNIAELFSPLNTGLTNLSVDPCQGAAPVTNANLRAVCLAQGAPANTIGLIAAPSAAQINATSGGQPGVAPSRKVGQLHRRSGVAAQLRPWPIGHGRLL